MIIEDVEIIDASSIADVGCIEEVLLDLDLGVIEPCLECLVNGVVQLNLEPTLELEPFIHWCLEVEFFARFDV